MSERRHLRLGLAQIQPHLGDLAANLQLHLEQIAQARDQGVQLLVFPELSLTGYYLRDLVPEVAVSRDSETLRQLCRESRDMSLVVGFVEETPAHSFHISAAFIEEGRIAHVHRKVYLPTYGMFDEARYLSEGDRIRVFDSRFGAMALLLCEDMWHLPLPYLAAQQGAKWIIVLANSPARGVDQEGLEVARSYYAFNRTYAELLQVFWVFVNRVGYEEGVCFWGGSEIVSPAGESLARAPLDQPTLLTADVDLHLLRRARTASPLLADERLELTLRELERVFDERFGD